MGSIATIYSLCSLCGPHAKRCARYNPQCNVPKEFTTSKKAHARSVHAWSKEIVKRRACDPTRVYHQSPMKLTETQLLAYFEDDWMD
jgi:hypothetical protein